MRIFWDKRRCVDALVRICEELIIEDTSRGKGRPNKYWGDVIRLAMMQLRATGDMTLDRRV
ncbi:hypothetical protein H5410_052207 [Solanum commersonii]|uniref:Uncharacterized protein n=1 Tax=Solanum commersonii TaxID=4109 RepID=A0A9J5X2Q6_SOLCO|nr:hypothetical protein H5410_052207 [Solanum commersonii]